MGGKVSRRRRNNTGQSDGAGGNEAVSPTDPTPSAQSAPKKVAKLSLNWAKI